MATIRATLRTIRDLGLSASWSSQWQEYRVRFRDGTAGQGYFTDDPQDAIATARAMLAERARKA